MVTESVKALMRVLCMKQLLRGCRFAMQHAVYFFRQWWTLHIIPSIVDANLRLHEDLDSNDLDIVGVVCAGSWIWRCNLSRKTSYRFKNNVLDDASWLWWRRLVLVYLHAECFFVEKLTSLLSAFPLILSDLMIHESQMGSSVKVFTKLKYNISYIRRTVVVKKSSVFLKIFVSPCPWRVELLHCTFRYWWKGSFKREMLVDNIQRT